MNVGDGDVGLDSDVAFSDGKMASRDAKMGSLDREIASRLESRWDKRWREVQWVRKGLEMG